MPTRDTNRPATKLPVMMPSATRPKQSPYTSGDTESTSIRTKEDPVMKANWPPNMSATTST